jgi:hypothetical protein
MTGAWLIGMEAGGVGPASGAASGGVASTTDVSIGAGMAFGSSGGTASDGLTAIEAGGESAVASSR